MSASDFSLEPAVHISLAVGAMDLTALAAQDGVLDAQERARADRFLFAADRDLYRAAHVLLRRALSRHVLMDAAAWRFFPGVHGRPEINRLACPAGARLKFNLAHTRGLVCCAVTEAATVGIDAEWERPLDDVLGLARYCFAPPEIATLIALPAPEQMRQFYALWTLKECFVKALGVGLSARLERFAFRLGQGVPGIIDLTLAPGFAHGPGCWRFVLLRIDDGGLLAAGVRAASGARFFIHPVSACGRLPSWTVIARSAGARIERGARHPPQASG